VGPPLTWTCNPPILGCCQVQATVALVLFVTVCVAAQFLAFCGVGVSTSGVGTTVSVLLGAWVAVAIGVELGRPCVVLVARGVLSGIGTVVTGIGVSPGCSAEVAVGLVCAKGPDPGAVGSLRGSCPRCCSARIALPRLADTSAAANTATTTHRRLQWLPGFTERGDARNWGGIGVVLVAAAGIAPAACWLTA